MTKFFKSAILGGKFTQWVELTQRHCSLVDGHFGFL